MCWDGMTVVVVLVVGDEKLDIAVQWVPYVFLKIQKELVCVIGH